MAGVPEQPRGPGPGRNEPEYEVIGGGLIDDQGTAERIAHDGPTLAGNPRGVFTTAAQVAWQDARTSFTSWWFWLACVVGIAAVWGAAAALVGWADAMGWFDRQVTGAVFLIMAALSAMLAAVLGMGWGFRHPAAGPTSRTTVSSVLALSLAGLLRGLALAAPAFVLLLIVGLSSGGRIALAGVAVVVIVLETAIFGLMGAGARACFAGVGPGVALSAALLAVLCFGNVTVTALLLPGTTGTDQASVPVNVERDSAGEITAYQCVGDLRPVEVARTERIAWLAASNPALLLGSVGAGFVPTDSEFGWVLAGLQWAADGPSRQVPCLGGESSEALPPTVPVAVTGFALQALVAALVLIPGRWLASRRPAAGQMEARAS
ncbi:hypothetical protein [Paenarthrobacter nitroguajacolicus]|uniref:hypothetical protein n=1 Tax=Paenarthrobacter nitroguajacolicus TaxID=211146 RepID=UPI00248C319B|nr:hypothetical protein [Paenarthrobacter nitroguajacolicus]MDI2036596.1 hypothetical protein [Paenarthrobacter nitroguajacolicus]